MNATFLAIFIAAAAPLPINDHPIEFQGDRMDVRRNDGYLRLKGNVKVDHGQTTLTADTMEIFYAPDGETIDRIHASGNVRMTEPGRKGTARNAVYTPTDRKLVLTGQPVIWEDDNSLAGDKITIYREPDRMEVNNARAVLQPDTVRESIASPPPATNGDQP